MYIRTDDYLNWFKSYTNDFYNNHPEHNRVIQFKVEHTYRVRENTKSICKQLKMSDQDMQMGGIISLFHDLGRFRQFQEYNTFVDGISVDHAKLSINEISRTKILKTIASIQRKAIMKAIYFHNKKSIRNHANDPAYFYMQLIRDADKLDILKLHANKVMQPESAGFIDKMLPQTNSITDQLLVYLDMKQQIPITKIKCGNDFKLFMLSWIFDINFMPTYQIIKKERWIDKIVSSLPQTQELTNTIRQLHVELDRRINFFQL